MSEQAQTTSSSDAANAGASSKDEGFTVEHGYVEEEEPEDPKLLNRMFFPSKFGGKPAWLVPENLPTNADL